VALLLTPLQASRPRSLAQRGVPNLSPAGWNGASRGPRRRPRRVERRL